MSGSVAVKHEFLSRLDVHGRTLAESGPGWLRELRRAGRARFDALGLPSPSVEAWRNTNVAPLAAIVFAPAAPTPEHPAPPAGIPALDLGSAQLTFVDGCFVPGLSRTAGLPDGVWAGSLAEALQRFPDRLRAYLDDPQDGTGCFRALNDGFIEDGACVLVPDRAVLERPIQVLYLAGGLAEPTASHPRTLFVTGREASASLVEVYAGLSAGAYMTNAVSQTLIGDGASATHYRVQLESENAYHIATIASRQGRDSRLDAYNINLGGRLVRHDLTARLDGAGADCKLYGLNLTHGAQHVDNHTTIDHAEPHGTSRELYKGILDDRSRTVFTGRIIVRPGAQKTDAKQSNPNLLLSTEALAHTRPQLEIYADDVKCTHGATVGQMDAESVFYLRSRGIPEAEARNLLIHAFAGEVLEQVADAALRAELLRTISQRLDEKKART